jgi:hypothetical protein
LVSLLASKECGAVVGFVGFRAGVDGSARAIGSGIRSDVARVNVIVFNKVHREAGLSEVDRHFVV